MDTKYYIQVARGYEENVLEKLVLTSEFTRLCVKRNVDDLKKAKKDNFGFFFDDEAAARPCRFLEQLPHVKGRQFKDKTLRLEAWQVWLITTLYGWKRNDTGYRRFQSAYIEVARKNGKTLMAAGLLLYHLLADNEFGAECYTAGQDEDTARLSFDAAKEMLNLEPDMKRLFEVNIFSKAISCRKGGSLCKMEPLARVITPKEGTNPSFAILDEVHSLRNPTIRESIKTGMGAREQPLLMEITTAGTDQSGHCFEQRGYIHGIVRGDIEDEASFGVVYTMDDWEKEWMDNAMWGKANPNLNVSVSEKSIANEFVEAKNKMHKKNHFLRTRMNIWTGANTACIDMVKWDQCGSDSLSLDNFGKVEAFVGIDLSSTRDLTAMAIVVPNRDADGRIDGWAVFVKHYMSDSGFVYGKHNTQRYENWVRETPEHLALTPGNTVDYNFLEKDLDVVCEKLSVVGVGFDIHNANQFSTRALSRGIKMVQVVQSTKYLSEPLNYLINSVLEQRVVHQNSAVLNWEISNLEARERPNNTIYPSKPNEGAKIDGCFAILNALTLMLPSIEDSEDWLEDGAFLAI